MSLTWAGSKIRRLGFPRVSGDEPRVFTNAGAQAMFSPRERG